MKSVELFSGCGGLALGLARAGFHHDLLVEKNVEAVGTIALNKKRAVEHVRDWLVDPRDVAKIDWSRFNGTVDLVAGGPPCQPFSIGGKHRGHEDTRDMWPEVLRAVREIAPPVFLFENVRGLARPAFAEYLRWIRTALANPTVEPKKNEAFADHLVRLEKARKASTYDVLVMKVNAADFGAPQKRMRVIVAGVRRDLGVTFEPPPPTHSLARLLWEQSTGEYWRRHRTRQPESLASSAIIPMAPAGLPWVTVRDALKGLGEPTGRANHVFQDGAKVYVGHTGSPLDEPAKALKAGDHGVPGGENMMVRADGSVRYFTVREAARLQGLPDDYRFDCVWSESMRQLGNAVPAQLSESLGKWLVGVLESAKATRTTAA